MLRLVCNAHSFIAEQRDTCTDLCVQWHRPRDTLALSLRLSRTNRGAEEQLPAG